MAAPRGALPHACGDGGSNWHPFACTALLTRLGPMPASGGWTAYLPPNLLEKAAIAEANIPEKAPPAAEADAGETSTVSSCCSSSSCAEVGATEPPVSQVGTTASGVSTPQSLPTTPAGDAARLLGRVWCLSRDPAGCRVVQDSLSAMQGGDAARRIVAAELRGHIVKATRCPHANHVLQRLIAVSSSEDCQFAVDELLARPGVVFQTARHRYGCRIVQQMLRCLPPAQLRPLCDALLVDARALCCHAFGSYVMQHLIKHGSEEYRRRVVDLLAKQASSIGQCSSGCAAIAAAMHFGAPHEVALLARGIAKEPELLETFAVAKHGHVLALLVLQALPEPDLSVVRERLLEGRATLLNSRYGGSIARFLTGEGGDSPPSQA